MIKDNRIVYRYRGKTVECFQADGKWWCNVQGVKEPRGPFDTPGRAVEFGNALAGKHAAVKSRIDTRRQGERS